MPLLIHIAFTCAIAFGIEALVRAIGAAQGWPFAEHRTAAGALWLAAIAVAVQADRIFERVFPLVPAEKRRI